MKRTEQESIKKEFDKSIKYLDSKGQELTIEECLRELGHLRMFIYDLYLIEKYKGGEEK